jgi:microcystin-dependent protein
MAQPYVGEIRLFAGNFAPAGWALCNGALIPISENETLFNLIGTTYGGDGQETFAVPDLQGRVPLHQGRGSGATYPVGEAGGVEEVTLTLQQIPQHRHDLLASGGPGTTDRPGGSVLATPPMVRPYVADTPDTTMATVVGSAGGSQPHENRQPFLAINYIISLFGLFPSQS